MIDGNVVKECVMKYKVSSNGRVIDKNSNEEIVDETLKEIIMTSFLVYSKAHRLYEIAKNQRQGKLNLPKNVDLKDYFIIKALNKYGLDGKESEFEESKLFNSLINGSNEQIMTSFADSLAGTKYEIFDGDNKKYGLAALKYLARMKGKDFSDIDVSIDLKDHQKTGISYIKVNTQSLEFSPNQDNLSEKQISEMGDSLKIAYLNQKANEYMAIGDETVANYYKSNVEMIKNCDGSHIKTEEMQVPPKEENIQQIITKLLQHDKNPEIIGALSELSGIPFEEAERQIDIYQFVEKHELELTKLGFDAIMQTKQKKNVIDKLVKYVNMGELPLDILQNMNQKIMMSLLQSKKTPETILRLSELTGLANEDVENQIDVYQALEKHELELIKSGLDSTMQARQKAEIISALTQYTMLMDKKCVR